MALRIVKVQEEPDYRDQAQKDLEFLTQYDNRFLACRGDHHQWPQLGHKADRKKIRHWIESAGVVEVEMTCRSCGRIRWKLIGRNAPSMGWKYKEPKGYKAPKDSELRRGDFSRELQRRFIEEEYQNAI